MEGERGRDSQESDAADNLSPELADLANEIEALPKVNPRKSWFNAAKRRLLRRFDRQRSPKPGESTNKQSDSAGPEQR